MSYPETMSELTNYPKALSHAESGGGGFTLKSVTITNGYTAQIELGNYVRTDGKWIGSAPLAVNESVTCYYPEPAENMSYNITIYASGTVQVAGADGFLASGPNILVDPSAEDGASITVEAGTSPE